MQLLHDLWYTIYFQLTSFCNINFCIIEFTFSRNKGGDSDMSYGG